MTLWDRNRFYAILANYTYVRNCKGLLQRKHMIIDMFGEMSELLPPADELGALDAHKEIRAEILRLLSEAARQSIALIPEDCDESPVSVLLEDMSVGMFFFPKELLVKYFGRVPLVIGAARRYVIENLMRQFIADNSNRNLDLSKFYPLDDEAASVEAKPN